MLGWPANILQDGMDYFKHCNFLLSTVINSSSSWLKQFLCSFHFKCDQLCCQSSANRATVPQKGGTKIAHLCFIPRYQRLLQSCKDLLEKAKDGNKGHLKCPLVMPMVTTQYQQQRAFFPTHFRGKGKQGHPRFMARNKPVFLKLDNF